MIRYVVDASVAVKWIVPEVFSVEAARLQPSENEVIAPDLLPLEVVSALLKKARRSEIGFDEIREGLELISLLVQLHPSSTLLDEALSIAVRYRTSLYDSLYVALALQEQCQLITADERLFSALLLALPERLLWVEDIPSPDPEGA